MNRPPYAFVPGHWPHPARDPRGHSFGRGELVCETLDPTGEAWRAHGTYVRALELFEHGYYWEAHEGLEAVWTAAGGQGAVADLMQGLIKLAAAAIKLRQGKTASAMKLAEQALTSFDKAEHAAGARTLAGLSFKQLRTRAREVQRIDPSRLSAARAVEVVLGPLAPRP